MKTNINSPQRLGNLLIERGYLAPADLTAALVQQKELPGGQSKLLGEILVELSYCTEEQVIECLAAEYDVPYARLEARRYDLRVVDVSTLLAESLDEQSPAAASAPSDPPR